MTENSFPLYHLQGNTQIGFDQLLDRNFKRLLHTIKNWNP